MSQRVGQALFNTINQGETANDWSKLKLIMFSSWLKISFIFAITINCVIKSHGEKSSSELDNLIEKSLVKFKLDVHKLLETNRLIRSRRSVNYGLSDALLSLLIVI